MELVIPGITSINGKNTDTGIQHLLISYLRQTNFSFHQYNF
jgi:hypothetical protein